MASYNFKYAVGESVGYADYMQGTYGLETFVPKKEYIKECLVVAISIKKNEYTYSIFQHDTLRVKDNVKEEELYSLEQPDLYINSDDIDSGQ